MGLMDNETFLPGVITEVESDYSYGYDSSLFGTTDSVVIVGTAFNGPTGQPIPVYSPEHARYIFGRTFDAATKKEATLVAGIEDAYQRGNRTIYAVRVGGQHVEKDFQLNTESKLKLRVRGAYPTNQAKDFFLTYDNTEGAEAFKIFKPAERATVVEKMQGAVESENAVIELDIRIAQDYGFTKDSLLGDVIDTVNSHPYNNVLRLSIVDEGGFDVTDADVEARTLPLGVIFPGAYLIGRTDNIVPASTEMKFSVIGETDKPYDSFEGLIYKELSHNTDLSADLPIFHDEQDKFARLLAVEGVYTSGLFDFLATAGTADRVFGKDKLDYEEVDLSKFEIYKRLGSGFAITARAEARFDGNGNELTPKVKETPVSDINRIAELKDGIYSMLENLNAKYRVLVCGNADDKIQGRLPRARDFAISDPISTNVLEGLIKATPLVKREDYSSAKNYKFEVKGLDPAAPLVASIDQVHTASVLPAYAIHTNDGSVVLADGTVVAVDVTTIDSIMEAEPTATGFVLQHFHNNKGTVKQNVGADLGTLTVIVLEEVIYKLDADGKYFIPATHDEIAAETGKPYLLVQNNNTVFATKLEDVAGAPKLAPLGDIETMFTDNEDQTIVFSQSNYFEENNVVIQSAMFDSITLEEFVEMLNAHNALNKLFNFELTNDGFIEKDEYVNDILIGTDELKDILEIGSTAVLAEDRRSTYDYNKYVPYKTSDNFARQLAQHCTYTSLKTAPSHGIIGMSLLNNTTLNGIANHVDNLLEKEFGLYAKTAQGRNMLDRNNMPYPLGKNLSITAMQYNVVLDSGYVYRSNGASGYAGMVSVLPLDQSSTNQTINLNEIAFELTNHQLTRLTQKGYVTVKNSYTKGFVITDGITFAPVESPFRRLNVSRIGNAIEELIREAAEPYIGKQNHAVNRNSLQTAIRSNLEKIKGTLIEAYEFSLVVDPAIMKFAYIDIDYNIVPIYEIREVRNRIKVKDQL